MTIEAFLLGLVHSYGYLGVFLASILGSAGIFIPLPSFIIVVAAGSLLDPLIVGISAGAGAAIGELIGYAIGLGLIYGKKKLGKRIRKESIIDRILPDWLSEKNVRKLFAENKGPLVIFIFAVTPLPDKVIGVICGAIRYDLKKFFIATLIGKIIFNVILAYIGFYGIDIVSNWFF